MRKFLSGFSAGVLFAVVLVFSLIPVYAAIEEYICYKSVYQVAVKGKLYSDTEKPILDYNGTTYIPIRGIFELADLDVNCNTELRLIEIDVAKKQDEVNHKLESSLFEQGYLQRYDPRDPIYRIKNEEIYIHHELVKNSINDYNTRMLTITSLGGEEFNIDTREVDRGNDERCLSNDCGVYVKASLLGLKVIFENGFMVIEPLE